MTKILVVIAVFVSIAALIVIVLAVKKTSYSANRELQQKAHVENSAAGHKKILRVAAVQMISENGDISGNLRRATGFVEKAAARGAKLILLPEFMPPGYILTEEIWNGGEPKEGPTVVWMKATSKRLGVWLGTSYLEAEGEDFYNTFVITNSEGNEDGRVRKQSPASGEAFFTKGQEGPHVITTRLGRIGVGICYENRFAYTPRNMYSQSVDLLLQPHAVPLPVTKGAYWFVTTEQIERKKMEFGNRPKYYADMLGVPVILCNHAGRFRSPVPGLPVLDTIFMGLSSIVDCDGTLKARLGSDEGMIVADVILDPAAKKNVPPVTYGRWSKPERPGIRYYFQALEVAGAVWYRFSNERRLRAREISSRH